MENLTIKTKKTLETDLVIPQYFSRHGYYFYKLIDDKTYLYVCNYNTGRDTMDALELFPRIEVMHIRYLENIIKPEDVKEITQEEFYKNLNQVKHFILSL